MDAGAYNGDTIGEFLELVRGRYKKIYAVEPDPVNYKKLLDYVRQNKLENVNCLQAGVWNSCSRLELTGNGGRQSTFWKTKQVGEVVPAVQDKENVFSNKPPVRRKKKKQQVKVVSVDSVLGNCRADYMKFDVEGMEKEALEGAAQHLIPDCNGVLPKLLVAAYHHDEDIFTLPLLLWKLQPQYRIYLRKHPYVPAWEINIFAK